MRSDGGDTEESFAMLSIVAAATVLLGRDTATDQKGHHDDYCTRVIDILRNLNAHFFNFSCFVADINYYSFGVPMFLPAVTTALHAFKSPFT